MTRRWFGVAFLTAEIGVGVALLLDGQARRTARTIYVWLWEHAPMTDGVPPPDRFAPR